jgi:toxin CcdB
MAQYDVYANPSVASRDAVPYVVDVQSGLLAQFSTRLTMPLLRRPAARLPGRLAPRLQVNGEDLVLYPHQAAVVETRLLKKRVASLATHAAQIVDALDTVISGV